MEEETSGQEEMARSGDRAITGQEMARSGDRAITGTSWESAAPGCEWRGLWVGIPILTHGWSGWESRPTSTGAALLAKIRRVGALRPRPLPCPGGSHE